MSGRKRYRWWKQSKASKKHYPPVQHGDGKDWHSHSNSEMQEGLSGAESEEQQSLLEAAAADLQEQEQTESSDELKNPSASSVSGQKTEDDETSSPSAGAQPTTSGSATGAPFEPLGGGQFRPDIVPNNVPIYDIPDWDSGPIPIPPELASLSGDQIQFSMVDGVMTARDRAAWRAQEQITRGTAMRNSLDLIARQKERDIRVANGEMQYANVAPADMPPPTIFAVSGNGFDDRGFAQYRIVPISPEASRLDPIQFATTDFAGSYLSGKNIFVNSVAEGDPTGDYQTARDAWENFTGRPLTRREGESWQACIRRVAERVSNASIPGQR